MRCPPRGRLGRRRVRYHTLKTPFNIRLFTFACFSDLLVLLGLAQVHRFIKIFISASCLILIDSGSFSISEVVFQPTSISAHHRLLPMPPGAIESYTYHTLAVNSRSNILTSAHSCCVVL